MTTAAGPSSRLPCVVERACQLCRVRKGSPFAASRGGRTWVARIGHERTTGAREEAKAGQYARHSSDSPCPPIMAPSWIPKALRLLHACPGGSCRGPGQGPRLFPRCWWRFRPHAGRCCSRKPAPTDCLSACIRFQPRRHPFRLRNGHLARSPPPSQLMIPSSRSPVDVP